LLGSSEFSQCAGQPEDAARRARMKTNARAGCEDYFAGNKKRPRPKNLPGFIFA